MGQSARKTRVEGDEWAVFGLEDSAIASFRSVARERAPGLAAAYGRRWRRVSGRVGRAPWPAPWPQEFGRLISWSHAGALALRALNRVDRPLGRRAAAVWHRGRVRPMTQLAPGVWRIQHRPMGASVRIGFDGSPASAAGLAQALWLAGQTTLGWFGPSMPAPPRAAAEAGGALAALAFAEALGLRDEPSAQRLSADAALAALVRLPAMDAALSLVGAGRDALSAWNEAAALFAPALAWGQSTASVCPEELEVPLVQAIGYASAAITWRGLTEGDIAPAMISAWSATGPEASLAHFAAFSDLALESASSWRGVYDRAEEKLDKMERAP